MSDPKKEPQTEDRSRGLDDIVPPGLCLGPQKQIEVTLPRTLAIVLTRTAFSQLFGFADATDLEVSLLGIVDRDKSLFTIREFHLVEQRGARSHTELEPSAVGELVEKLIAEGRSNDAKNIRCWAHSHPGMGVFWSQTDDHTSRLLCADWLVSLVVSDGFKVRCRIDVAAPIPFTLDHVPVYCESLIDSAIAGRCKDEIKDKLTHVPLFGRPKDKPKDKREQKMKEPTDQGPEILEYCDMCGGWHLDGECPMQLESSAYELAHNERVLETESNVWGDNVWF